METLKFNDGTEYECTYCAVAPDIGVAYIAIEGPKTISEATAIFEDTNKTAHMEYNGISIDGFTDLVYVLRTDFGMKARLNYNGGNNG